MLDVIWWCQGHLTAFWASLRSFLVPGIAHSIIDGDEQRMVRQVIVQGQLLAYFWS